MNRKFKPGDMVIVIKRSVHFGQVTTVIGPLELLTNTRTMCKEYVHKVDIPARLSRTCIAFKPEHLIPYDEGRKPASWDEAIWKPQEKKDEKQKDGIQTHDLETS